MPEVPHPQQTLRVLLVDDEPQVRLVTGIALKACHSIEVVGEAADGVEAIELYEELLPDVTVMDVEMPRLNGSAATEAIVAKHPDARIIALTGHIEGDVITRMIVAGAVGYAVKGSPEDDLCQIIRDAAYTNGHVDPQAVPGLFESVLDLARSERIRREQAERASRELKRIYQETVRALTAALKSRDYYTGSHGDRVAQNVVDVGRLLELDEQRLSDLEYAAIFHDIGKIGIPDSILHNADDLTEAEWEIVRRHTLVGEQIIAPIGFLREVAKIVRHSHEHWDGSGYPDGLVGKRIPLESRIIFACDAFDAMTSHRAYQATLTHDEAIARLQALSGKHFDPMVVDALITVQHSHATH